MLDQDSTPSRSAHEPSTAWDDTFDRDLRIDLPANMSVVGGFMDA